MSRTIYILAMISYILATLFVHVPIFKLFVSIMCLLAVCTGLRRAKGLALLFGLFFLGAGSLMLAISGAGPNQFVRSFGEMIQMVTLFALIPILSLPIQLGRYADEIQMLVQRKVSSRSQFYALISGISFFFSSFLNLAALPLTYHAIGPSLSHFSIARKNRFLSQAITHGYAMPLLWSPITPIVGTVLYLTGTTYSRVLPPLILLSICGVVLDWTTSRHSHINYHSQNKVISETAAGIMAPADKGHPEKLWQIAWVILLLNAIIIVLDHFLSFNFLFLVSLIVIPFAFVWCAMLSQVPAFFSGVRHHFRTYIPRMQNQFFIFLTAGFFITALRISHMDTFVTRGMDSVIQFTGLRLFLIMLPLIPFALAFLGLHPAVGLALISEALRSQALHQAPIIVTVAMLGGAVPAFLMGPYNATLGMMSGLINERPTTLSHWNLPFTWRYLILLTVFVQAIYAK